MKIKLKVKKSVGIKKAGEIVEVQTCENGVPLDKFWRDRLKDSEIDGCIEVVKDEPVKTKRNK